MARKRESRRLSEDVLRSLADHEAGHATVALILGRPIAKAQVNFDNCTGSVHYLPSRMTEQASLSRLAINAGGLIAERLLHGGHDEGSGEDIRKLTLEAVRHIDHFGLSGRYPLDYSALLDNTGLRSDKRSAALFQAVEQLVQEACQHAEAILRREALLHRAISEALYVKKLLRGSELIALCLAHATDKSSDAL